ncbi:MAG: zinc-ribbon domain-containing protein [Candidatus Helarchaeota archaeon]
MRNRYCRWRYFNNNSNNNLTNSRFNNFTYNTQRTIRGYSYVGPCRCGYGPNAFYKRNSDNKIVNFSEIQKIQKNSKQNTIEPSYKKEKSEVKFCHNCGASLYPNSYYCSECGAYIGGDDHLSKKEDIEELKNQIKEIKKKIKNYKKKGG